ncbi:uncharacterized [Tachysurus ichikawai]
MSRVQFSSGRYSRSVLRSVCNGLDRSPSCAIAEVRDRLHSIDTTQTRDHHSSFCPHPHTSRRYEDTKYIQQIPGFSWEQSMLGLKEGAT